LTCYGEERRYPKENLATVDGIGNVTVQLKNGKRAEIILMNVVYAQSYDVNLLSVDMAVCFGHRLIFHVRIGVRIFTPVLI
jgi:hypothetical protein